MVNRCLHFAYMWAAGTYSQRTRADLTNASKPRVCFRCRHRIFRVKGQLKQRLRTNQGQPNLQWIYLEGEPI